MAERKQVEKAQRMDRALPFQVRLNPLFQRSQIREQVAMRDAHTFRFGGRARGENYLDRIIFINVRHYVRRRRMMRNQRTGLFQGENRKT